MRLEDSFTCVFQALLDDSVLFFLESFCDFGSKYLACVAIDGGVLIRLIQKVFPRLAFVIGSSTRTLMRLYKYQNPFDDKAM